jgi:hypothetical protein
MHSREVLNRRLVIAAISELPKSEEIASVARLCTAAEAAVVRRRVRGAEHQFHEMEVSDD